MDVEELAGKKSGDNPHLWYDTTAVLALAKRLAHIFSEIDSSHAADYAARYEALGTSLTYVRKKIDCDCAEHEGSAISATEPVFGYMASALGLEVRNQRFQLSVMNDTEPSARDIAAFERDLNEHKVKLLLFNKQAMTLLARRIIETARRANVPVVGITETKPVHMNYQEWMLMQLDELQKALADPSK